MTKTRYVQVGLGARSWMYSLALGDRFGAHGELVGLCDRNPGRLAQRLGWARSAGLAPAVCAPEGFPALLREARPDVVLVTTDDCDHDAYAVPRAPRRLRRRQREAPHHRRAAPRAHPRGARGERPARCA